MEEWSDDVVTDNQIVKTSGIPDYSLSNFKVKCADFNNAYFITGMLNPVQEKFEDCKGRQSNVQCQKPVRKSCNSTTDGTNRGDPIEDETSKSKVGDKGQMLNQYSEMSEDNVIERWCSHMPALQNSWNLSLEKKAGETMPSCSQESPKTHYWKCFFCGRVTIQFEKSAKR